MLLYGARQIGKTYLLKEFGRKSFEKYHYFNFEEDRRLHTPFKQYLTPQRVIEETISSAIYRQSGRAHIECTYLCSSYVAADYAELLKDM